MVSVSVLSFVMLSEAEAPVSLEIAEITGALGAEKSPIICWMVYWMLPATMVLEALMASAVPPDTPESQVFTKPMVAVV